MVGDLTWVSHLRLCFWHARTDYSQTDFTASPVWTVFLCKNFIMVHDKHDRLLYFIIYIWAFLISEIFFFCQVSLCKKWSYHTVPSVTYTPAFLISTGLVAVEPTYLICELLCFVFSEFALILESATTLSSDKPLGLSSSVSIDIGS